MTEHMELAAAFDYEQESWQFALFGIWFDGESYWAAADSGCSCPSPWESHDAEYIRSHAVLGGHFDYELKKWIDNPNTALGFAGALKALDDFYQTVNPEDGCYPSITDDYRSAREALRKFEVSRHA